MFEIEKVEMPSIKDQRSKGYTDTLKKLGINDSSSFFIPLGNYGDLGSLRSSIGAIAHRSKIRISVRHEFKFCCEQHGKYTERRNRPKFECCKLIDRGIRIWRSGNCLAPKTKSSKKNIGRAVLSPSN